MVVIWCDLFPMSLCIEVEPGYYVTIAEATCVSEDVASESEERGTMPKSKWFEVVELIATENCIRGKLAEDGWISIMNTKTGFWYVEPWARYVR